MESKETIITLKVEASKANQEVEGVKKNIDNAEKSTKDLNKTSSKTPKLLKGIGNGFKFIGTAMKAAGIGLVITLFAKLTEVLSKNQKVVDIFNKVMTTLEIMFNDFFSLLTDNIEPIKEFFADIFENPVENIKALGTAIKDNIIERIESAIMVFGLAGKAIKQFMDGDFSGAADTAKQAGKELVDVATGVDDSFNKISDGVGKAVDKISEYAEETYNSADALVELRKEQRLQEARLRGITLEYQNQQETLRQTRDDERNTIDERIKANEDLADSLIEQGNVEKGIIRDRISLIQQEIANGDTSIEKQEELINAKNDLVDVEERINGFRSEQQINENALQKEREENLKQLKEIGKTEEELARQELENQLENRKKLIEVTVESEEEQNRLLLEAQKEYNDGLVALEEDKEKRLQDVLNEFIPEDEQGLSEAEKFEKERERKREQFEKELEDLKESEEEKARLLREFDEDTTERSIELAEREAQRKKALKEMEVSMALGALSTITNALAEGSDIAKGFAAAEATWSAFKAINAALGDDEIPFPIRVANAVAIGAQAFANVKSIMDTDPQKGGQNINGSGGNQRNVISQSPRFDVVGDSSRLRDLEDEENREPQESYVVSKKVSNQQELDRNKQTNSRFI